MTVLAIFSGDLWAGAEVVICTLLGRLQRTGRVRLIALGLNEGTLTQRLRAHGIETHVLPEDRHTFPVIVLRALRLLRGRRIDIIHSHRYKENVLGALLAPPLRATRLVATVHGLPEWAAGERPDAGRLVRLDHAILRRRFDRVVAVSHDIRRRLTREFRLPPERVHVIHNGLTMPDASGPPVGDLRRRHGLHVGSVGRLVPVKDYGLFLDTAARIRARQRGVRFSILGEGPLRGDLFRRSIQLGLADCFQILPPLADPFPYYRTLDVYLNTSRHEGIPMSLLEAMACGVPVVAPEVGGIPEMITHGADGYLVRSRRADDLARTCLDLLRDPAGRRSVQDKARETVAARFSADVMASRYLELYDGDA
jgi:glycosyltransferase involved in cell wall biosynthesis